MAGDWIKIEHVTPDKPEVVKIASDLGIDQDSVVGKLIRLWIWADQNSIDGCAFFVTKTFIDRITFATGFSDALQKVGWLEVRSGSLSIPHFSRHNGQTAKSRADSARRMAKSRSKNENNSCDNVAEKTQQKPQPEKEKSKIREESKKEERESQVNPAPSLPFDSESFSIAWKEWEEHLKFKDVSLSPAALRGVFGELKSWGEDRSIKAISYSIKKNGKSIFEETQNNSKKSMPMSSVKLQEEICGKLL